MPPSTARLLSTSLRRLAVERIERVGRVATVVDALTAEELDAPDALALLDGAALLYLQGGNPRYIVDCLKDSVFCAHIRERGLPVLTTSGGAMALGERCPNMKGGSEWMDGLKMLPMTVVAAHWETLEARSPGIHAACEAATAEPWTLLALDEETAAVRSGASWEVGGPGAVRLKRQGAWTELRQGERFELRA